jgi:putative ABC transport system permease protein
MIGLALVTTVFIVGTSMKKTFAEAIEGSVGADYVLSTASFSGFSPALTADLAEIPEVSAVTGLRFNTIRIEGSSRDVVAADASSTDQLVDIDVQTGSLAELHGDAIFLHEDPARDLGVTVGDHVTVEMAVGGPRELTVAGTHADATFAGNYLIDLDLFDEGYPAADLDFFAFARLADGADPAVARAAIDEAMASYPQVTLEDRSEWQASQEEQFNSLLIAVNGLLGLALFIALLGIANTLALSVLERTREIGLLRAVGMHRRQVREMVLAESAMVAIFGAVLGVGIGTAFGLAIAVAMPPSVVTVTAVPFGTIAVIVAIAALCGLVAGLLPARRAARLDILRAVASE